jgi:ABC-2 type transport system ATP-binding protein
MQPVVRLEKVSRCFGKLRALNELSLEVREGEIYGFLGRNGAGKTTTLRILIGNLKPDAGNIDLFGSRVRRVTVQLKQRMGYVLSVGTRAKLGLTLALASRPSLLLLDEPTAGLDPVARREFNDQLAQLHRERGTTVLLSSHQVGEVEQVAQRVGIIQSGRACFEGDAVTLRAQVRQVTAPAPLGARPLER